MDLTLNYEPLPWQIKAHQDTNEHLACVGGLGSGKTSFAIRELQQCALANPKGLYLIARVTLPSLRDSTYRAFFEHTEPELIKRHNKANMTVTLINDAEFIFRPLDDMEKFKSMQISGFFIDEVNEVEEEMYNTLRTRVRQKFGDKQPFYRTIAAMNPEDETHWTYRRFVARSEKNESIHFSTTLDNQKNLPTNYIEDLKSMYSEDMQKRMIYGMYGRVFKGNPVFPQFGRNFDLHVRNIDIVDKYPIWRGIDFGFNHPACVWMQYVEGQLRILEAKLGEKIYLEDFVQDVIFPTEKELFGKWIHGYKTICDPAGSQESDKGRSSVEILQDFGIAPMFKRTKIEEGLKAIKHFLDTKTPGGDTNFLVHPRCKHLIDGLKGGYSWDDKLKAPKKDNNYDHELDCLRYTASYLYKWSKAGAMSNAFSNNRRYISPTGTRIIEY